ncbi:MAG: hypothetical protein GXP31_13175 [Kiritimatiellaeota bacterium]|nr:hypothetical protein [Kiritimatiellota bacterium]
MTLFKTPWSRIALNAAEPDEAVIDIDGYIGPAWFWDEDRKANTKEVMKAELKRLAELRVKRIIVNISSPGGDVDHGLAIHDLPADPAEIVTNITGMTASAATIIAQAGNDRRISANALYLIHLASTYTGGNSHDIALALDDLEKINRRIAELYARRGNRTAEEYLEIMDRGAGRGQWLSPQEARELGLVDTIYEPMQAAAAVTDPGLVRALAARGIIPLPAGLPAPPENPKTEQTPKRMKGRTDPKTSAQPKKGPAAMLSKEQLATIRDLFGADAALDAVQTDAEYNAALEAGARNIVQQLEQLRAKLQDATESAAALENEKTAQAARIAELENRVKTLENGIEDPLETNENREDPPEPDKNTQPKPIDQAHADLVAGGMSKIEAWKKLATERPEDYAKHFSMD